MKDKLRTQLTRFYKTHDSCRLLTQYIGCDRDYFKQYIDSKHVESMSFINIGKEWQFDHIVPLDLFSNDEMHLAWNYQNILPMLSKDNKNKGASVHLSLVILRSLPNTNVNQQLIVKCELEVNRLNSLYASKIQPNS